MLGMWINKNDRGDNLDISIFDYSNDYSNTLVHFHFVDYDEDFEPLNDWQLKDLKLNVTAATNPLYTNILQSALWTFANKQLTDPFDVIRWVKNSNIGRIEPDQHSWFVSEKDPLLSETW